jgi:hypothetical protein
LDYLGRFNTHNKFSERHLDFFPYQYAGNNPVLNIDVNGDSIQATSDAIANRNYVYHLDSFPIFTPPWAIS